MTTAITVRAAKDINEIQQVARLLAMSGYFDAKGNSEQAIAQIATKILAGREMGYGEFTSVQGIHVIQGRPAMSANLMAAAVKASARYDYRVRQMDDSAVKIEFFERIGGKLESLGTSTFTADDAKKAGTQNMAKFGRNMMFARAMSNGVRWFCPDVFFGNAVYTPEELGAPVDGDGNVINADYHTVPASVPATNGNGTNGHASNGNMIDVRSVDTETGEIHEAFFAGNGNHAQQNGNSAPSEKQIKALHALGVKLYGKENWDAKRASLILAVTKGRTGSAAELTKGECSTLLDGLKKKESDMDAALTAAASAEPHNYDDPFGDAP